MNDKQIIEENIETHLNIYTHINKIVEQTNKKIRENKKNKNR